METYFRQLKILFFIIIYLGCVHGNPTHTLTLSGIQKTLYKNIKEKYHIPLKQTKQTMIRIKYARSY